MSTAGSTVLTSTSFLLRASLALSSIGVKPSSLAHRCALVVLPMPGGPVIKIAREVFMPFLPGFLKPDFKLDGLQCVSELESMLGFDVNRPVVKPKLEFLYLALVATNLLQGARSVSVGPELARQWYRSRLLLVSLPLLSFHLIRRLTNGILLLLDLLLEFWVSDVRNSRRNKLEETILIKGLYLVLLDGSELSWPCVFSKDDIICSRRRLSYHASVASLTRVPGYNIATYPPNRFAISMISSLENEVSSPVNTSDRPERALGSAVGDTSFDPGAEGPAASFAALAAQLLP